MLISVCDVIIIGLLNTHIGLLQCNSHVTWRTIRRPTSRNRTAILCLSLAWLAVTFDLWYWIAGVFCAAPPLFQNVSIGAGLEQGLADHDLFPVDVRLDYMCDINGQRFPDGSAMKSIVCDERGNWNLETNLSCSCKCVLKTRANFPNTTDELVGCPHGRI